MFRLLKNFFGANKKNSTPSEWTDESWSADSYEKMLTAAAAGGVGSALGAGLGVGLGAGVLGGLSGAGSASGFDSGSVFDTESSSTIGGDGPAFNIDGTPMMGSFDMNGNVYGVTSSASMFDSHSHTDSSWSSGSDSFGSSWSSDNHF